MDIISSEKIDKSRIADFFEKNWGSATMVVTTGVYNCGELPGFGMMENNDIIGYISYNIDGDECEIISLDSLREGTGVGSALLKKGEANAKSLGCSKMKLITTNDNLHALAFYQRRGYRISKVYPDAVAKAREIKPEIPLIAGNGIEIRDELLLEKSL